MCDQPVGRFDANQALIRLRRHVEAGQPRGVIQKTIAFRSSTSDMWLVSNGGGKSVGSTSAVRSWINLPATRARSASDTT